MPFSFTALPEYLATDTTGFVPFECFPPDEASQAEVEDAPTRAVWWTFRERSIEPPTNKQKVRHTSSIRASFHAPGSKRAVEAAPTSGVRWTDKDI
ncbi:MAG: hypothetical protein M1839_008391 [Geoglossum umbratile]|nr:MAG: hypothetical protein M1839_008391 [Geoglossum umbratile]